MMEYTAQDTAAFWSKVDKNHPNGCWIWRGSISYATGGYGLFDRRRNGVRWAIRAHRFAYILTKGPIPDGMMLRHSCDTPACVNPDHLTPGTAKDNSRDMVQRRRHWTQQHPERVPRGADHWISRHGSKRLPRGESHPHAKLTAHEVLSIRTRYESGEISQRQLAEIYKVSQGTIWQIVNGRYWKEVTEDEGRTRSL